MKLARTKARQLGGVLGAAAAAGVVVVGCMVAQSGSESPGVTSVSLPPECAAEAAPLHGNPPQHPDPCHGNPNFVADGTAVLTRGDVTGLPGPLKSRLRHYNQLGRTESRLRRLLEDFSWDSVANTLLADRVAPSRAAARPLDAPVPEGAAPISMTPATPHSHGLFDR